MIDRQMVDNTCIIIYWMYKMLEPSYSFKFRNLLKHVLCIEKSFQAHFLNAEICQSVSFESHSKII